MEEGLPSSSSSSLLLGGGGRFILPWISRMARPEGVWRSGGKGFVGLEDGSSLVLVLVLLGSLFMPVRLDLWRGTVGMAVIACSL